MLQNAALYGNGLCGSQKAVTVTTQTWNRAFLRTLFEKEKMMVVTSIEYTCKQHFCLFPPCFQIFLSDLPCYLQMLSIWSQKLTKFSVNVIKGINF